jgi:hypothetical protein
MNRKTRKKMMRIELFWGPFDGRIMRVPVNTAAIELTTDRRTYHYSVLFDDRRPLRALFVA